MMKKVFNSLREDKHSSMYQQAQSLQELYGKCLLVESAINSRPILSISKSHETLMLTPKELLSPFLSSSQVELWVTQAMFGLTGPPDISPDLKARQQCKIRTLYYGTQKELDRHLWTLTLLHRKSGVVHGIPLDPTELPHNHGDNVQHPEVDILVFLFHSPRKIMVHNKIIVLQLGW